MTAYLKLNPPVGYKPYGASENYMPSPEVVNGQPVNWFSQCGTGPWGFGHYVFRQVGAAPAEYIRYKDGLVADVMDGRGELRVENGVMYVTGNESDADKTVTVYLVPGYVPFTNTVHDLPAAVLTRLASLEMAVSKMGGPVSDELGNRLAAVEGVAAKANERGLNALTQLQALKTAAPVSSGVSRDDVWQLAKDSVFDDLGHDSGIRTRVLELAKTVVVASPGGIDQPARDIANRALQEVRTLKEQVNENATNLAAQITDAKNALAATLDSFSAVAAKLDSFSAVAAVVAKLRDALK